MDDSGASARTRSSDTNTVLASTGAGLDRGEGDFVGVEHVTAEYIDSFECSRRGRSNSTGESVSYRTMSLVNEGLRTARPRRYGT